MRPKADYIALQRIVSNGVTAYQPGDDVPTSAVENLGLVLGEQVRAAHGNVIPRPAGNAKRAEWERYWQGQGVSQEEIDGMTRDEMAAREPAAEPPDGVNLTPNPQPDVVAEQATEQVQAAVEAPGSHGTKAEWVEYAVRRGMPREAAEEATIKDLEAYDYNGIFGVR